MFFLRDFPTPEMFDRVRGDFPQLEPEAIFICIRLLVLGSELLTRLDRTLEPFDLSHGRWVVLMLLRRRKVWQALPSELAEEQGVTRATMTGLLGKLEQQGLVRRQEDPEDGRRMVVVLTNAGAELVGRVLPACYELARHAMANLEPDEKTCLIGLLDKILEVVR